VAAADDRIFPLAAYGGSEPPAPAWFTSSVARIPEPSWLMLDAARIESFVWGRAGAPGLLFVHGARAHAGWWNFLAPLLADTHRVASFSFSGMGGSQWRDHYSMPVYAEELLATAEVSGLFANRAHRPIVIAHSFGARVALLAARRWGQRLGGCIIVDSVLQARRAASWAVPARVFKSHAEALTRFRLAPSQPCDNPFIVDFLARHALTRSADGCGWVWRFDPKQLQSFNTLPDQTAELREVQCPLAFVYGECSSLTPEGVRHRHRQAAAPGTESVILQKAHHHVMADQPLKLVSELQRLIRCWHPQPHN
jgi:pimeloyl-ACP methyl ester carboxylesterase